MKFFNASILRDKTNLNQIENKPGLYKWWARKEEVKSLLNSSYLTKDFFSDLLPKLSKKKFGDVEYYYIYVGIAVKESIRARFNWHINQKHTKCCIINGTLSTLRVSLSSLIFLDRYNEFGTNEFIDKLIIEYDAIDFPIKSDEAKNIIEGNEKIEMQSNVLPLNIRENYNKECLAFKKELKNIRKLALYKAKNN